MLNLFSSLLLTGGDSTALTEVRDDFNRGLGFTFCFGIKQSRSDDFEANGASVDTKLLMDASNLINCL